MSERSITPLIVIALLLGTLLALRSINSSSVTPVPVSSVVALAPGMVSLVTGDEPITEIFTKAGCSVCHTVPGIPGADGHVGPPLLLGATGPARLADPAYRGHAKTVHDDVMRRILSNKGSRVFSKRGDPRRIGDEVARVVREVIVYAGESRFLKLPPGS